MKPTLYRQDAGEVVITVEFGDGHERELRVDKHNLNLLLQVTLCALHESGDGDLIDAAFKTTRAWLR